MDRLGHYEHEEITADGAIVPDAGLVAIERQSATEVAVAILRPGRDAVIYTLRSEAPIVMAHYYDIISELERYIAEHT